MNNIMIISPFLPWPLNSGGNTGVFYMLEYVAKYENVYFVTIYNKRANNYDQLEALKKRLPNVHFLMYDYRNTVYKKYEYVRKLYRHIGMKVKFGESSCSMDSLNVLDSITPGLVEYVNREIERNKINIVQIEFLGLHPLVFALPNHVKKIFIHHELGWVRDELTYGKDVYSTFYKEMKKCQEISVLNKFDVVAALTDVDKEKLYEAGVKTQLKVSTLAISNHTLEQRNYQFNNRLTFIGGSAHFPNYEGLKWFVLEVMPLISHKHPNIELDVIGSWSDDAKNDVLSINDHVNFLGFVDELGDGLKDSIMVVPINIGSGMRMKILEAANFSVPFVSTVVGAEGLAFKSEYDCYIAKTAAEMAEEVLLLAENSQLYNALSVNVHEAYKLNYSIESLGKKRLELYD